MTPKFHTIGRWLLTIILFLLIATPASSARIDEVDHIIAIVDDDVVLRSELESQLDQLLIQLRQQSTPLPPRHVLERHVLERLISTKLQLAAAAKAGITVGEEILAQAISNIARNNNTTISEFSASLKQEGISLHNFREQIRKKIIIQQMLDNEMRQRVQITNQEVEAYLAQQAGSLNDHSEYHLGHILIATPEGASPERLRDAKNKAEQLVRVLRKGADFHSVALSQSHGQRALQGGDLGWRKVTQLPTLFAQQATRMKKGTISDPIRSASGFHIIQLIDFKGGSHQIITQTHARHILIQTNEITSDEDARIRLEQLKQRLEGGDNFATLARSHSNDQGSAIKGGDLGWLTPGNLLPTFEEIMNALPINGISIPFRTQFGWHIVQVLERRKYDSTQEVQKAKARDAIRKRKSIEETELYLRRLRDEAYVEIWLERE